MDEPVIRIERAVVRHRNATALDGVSLQVMRGEFVGVIGPNGAGKTTLLRAINGLVRLADGSVHVLGMRPYHRNGYRLRRRIGYLAQVETVDPRLPVTVRETVLTGSVGRLGCLHRPAKSDWRLVDEALERVGSAHLAQRPVGHLSGGEYQRVAIARTLVQQPAVFLFDEPTASIDPEAQRDILALIQNIHAEFRTTCLYVTHDLDALPESCRRLVLMRHGKIWRDGPRERLMDDSVLAPLYNGERR